MNGDLWPIASVSIALTVLVLGVLFVWMLSRERKSGYPRQDERTSRINGKAALGTYYIGIFFMVAELLWLIFAREFLGQPEPEAGYMLVATMLVLGGSFGGLRWYYGRKGDT